MAKFAQVVGDIGGSIEHGFVLALEAVRRAWSRLDPRLYSADRRIRQITTGSASTASAKFAVFVIYARGSLPAFTTNFITALNRNSYNVIVVSNAELDAAAKAELLSNCCLLIERQNFGRDFGGYKDGIDVALQRFQKIERLVIANDSLFYFERGLDRLVAGLDGPQDFIGVSEVFEHHYHAASFLLSFGPGVLEDPVFRQFWAGYRPIPTRMWAILEGEGELTRRLMNAGHCPHILFQAAGLSQKLRSLSAPECANTIALFPAPIRETLLPAVTSPLSAGGSAAGAFAETVFEAIMQRNQMHAAGFAFMKFLGMPLFKRDVVYRGLFTVEEADKILAEFGEPLRAEVVADLARRPPPGRSLSLQRLLYNHGYA